MDQVVVEKPLTPIAEYSKTAAALADLASRYKGVVFDVAKREGMVAAIKGRAELRGYRVALEKTRIEIKAPALERSRLIDTEAKRIKDAIAALEDPIDEAIKTEESRKERERAEKEAAELARVTDIQTRISHIVNMPSLFVGKPSATILARLDELNIEPGASWAQEFQTAAEDARAQTSAGLQQLYAGALAQEQAAAAEAERVRLEREELARLRSEAQERAKEEKRLMDEAMARRLAEEKEARAAIEAEQKASREKIATEEREALRVREEADRQAAAERAAVAAKAKAEQDAKDVKDRQERAAREAEANQLAKVQAEEAARLRAAQEALEAEKREVARRQEEVLQTDRLIGVLRNRIKGEKRYAVIAKAIEAWYAKQEEKTV